MEGLEQALTELDQQVADELLALAVEIARQVVRREISAHPEVILGVVHEALEQLPHQHATIYLNPEDSSLVRSHLGDSLAHAGHRILEAPHLKQGDCLVEVGGSQIVRVVSDRLEVDKPTDLQMMQGAQAVAVFGEEGGGNRRVSHAAPWAPGPGAASGFSR